MKKKALTLLGVLMMLTPAIISAQSGPDTPPPGFEMNGPDPPPPDPPPSTITQCVSFLVITGVCFGFKKLNIKK